MLHNAIESSNKRKNLDYDPKYKIEFHRHEKFPMVIYAKPNLEKDVF